MPDVLPFLQNREVLTFRWTANTPRSSLRQPLRAEELAQRAHGSSSSSSSSNGSVDGSGGSSGSRTARGVRWDASVVAKEEKARTASATTTEPLGSARPYRYSATARAEHSRRVLDEQEQRRRKEESVQGASDDPFKAVDKQPDTSPQTLQDLGPVSNADTAASNGVIGTNIISETSSSPTYPITADRGRINSDEEQQNSSPIASPTRNIRGAQKSNNEWTTPLGSDRVEVTDKAEAPRNIEEEIKAVKDSTMSEAERTPSITPAADTKSQHDAARPDVEANSGIAPQQQLTVKPASPSRQAKAARCQTAYQRMSSVVDALRDHPLNHYFRQAIHHDPSNAEFLAFLGQQNRPIVDFSTISSKIQYRQYGQEEPFNGFASDLNQMWSNARSFYGPVSLQAQCADFLDRFSRIIMVEWRREGDARGRSQEGEGKEARNGAKTKEQAMAHAAKLIHSMTYGSPAMSASAGKNVRGNERRMPKQQERTAARATAHVPLPRSKQTQETSLSQQQHQAKVKVSPRTARLAHQNLGMHDKSGEAAYTPRTHAFLATLFAKGNAAAQPTSASSDMMTKLQQQFVTPTDANMAAMRTGSSPAARKQPPTAHIPGTPSKQGTKRAAPTTTMAIGSESAQRPTKRAHVETQAAEHVQQTTTIAAPERQKATMEVPVVTLTDDGPQKRAPAPSVEASPAALVTTEEDAVEAATVAVSTPLSSVQKANKAVRSSPRSAASAAPRRSPRRTTPTAKLRNADGKSPNGSPVPSKADTVAQVQVQKPQRMVTRGVAAAVGRPTRRQRASAA